MPQLDTTGWNVASQTRKQDPGVIYGVVARDITPNQDLSQEPEFPKDNATDREDETSSLRSLIARIPHGPLRGLDPKKLNSKAQLFEQLTKGLPLNELNLPNFIYRPDLLDHQQIAETLIQAQNPTPPTEEPDLFYGVTEHTLAASESTSSSRKSASPGIEDITASLEAAMVTLDYSEGFPALEDGTPLWQRLHTETEESYDAFVAYLEVGGARKRTDLIAYPPQLVGEWFHINFWTYRVKAFELFRIVNHNKKRILRMLNTEENHFTLAEKAMVKIGKVFEAFEEDDFKALGIEKLTKVMMDMAKLQRVSTGLKADGGAVDPEDLKRAPTTQVVVQQIVANTPDEVRAEAEKPDLLRDMPDAVEDAQRLIVTMMEQQDLQQ